MIVVLTLGRSGSSLLMQTLRELGVDVAGRDFRTEASAEHYQGNPKGYWEDPQIYHHGIASENFQTLISSPNRACKMDLRHLFNPSESMAWLRSEPRLKAIYISIREPSEQARSEYMGQIAKHERTPLLEFQFTTTFLIRYVRVFHKIAAALDGDLRALKPKIHLVNYADAQRNSPEFVRRVVATAKLNSTRSQIESAAENIDPNLHRIQFDNLSPVEHQWAQKLQARDLFELLSSTTNPWSQLLMQSGQAETTKP